jgi:predicted protein tyrosine phosphatase
MLKEVSFVSEREAIELPPRIDTAMISITDSGRVAKLKDRWGVLLRVDFPDITYDEKLLREYGNILSPKWAITDVEASQMRQFILALRFMPQIETLIVHCHAGKSRSAAAAKFAAEMFGLPFDHAYDGYNTTVYELLHNPNKYVVFYPWRTASKHPSQQSREIGWIGWIKLWFASWF